MSEKHARMRFDDEKKKKNDKKKKKMAEIKHN